MIHNRCIITIGDEYDKPSCKKPKGGGDPWVKPRPKDETEAVFITEGEMKI